MTADLVHRRQHDKMIAPKEEKSIAKQMNVATTVLSSRKVLMLSQPNKVAEVIEDAAPARRNYRP